MSESKKGNKWKWFLILLLVFFALVYVGLNHFFYNIQNYIHPALMPPIYAIVGRDGEGEHKGRIIEIANRQIKVPLKYLDVPLRREKKQKSILMMAALPDLEAIPDLNDSEYAAFQNERRWFQIHVKDQSKTTGIEYRAETTLNRLNVTIRDSKEEIYGLMKYVPDLGKTSIPWDHLYLEINAGKIISFIKCTSPAANTPYKSCSHYFYDKNLLYDVGYDKSKLGNWREHRQQAIKFIDSLEIGKDDL